MATIKETVEVDVPVHAAYQQWTQFEEFPRFMEEVHEVRQIDETHLHWVAEVAGREAAWDAEIVEQDQDRRIAWRSIAGTRNDGAVAFESLGDSLTRVHVAIEHEAEDLGERAGMALGLVQRRVRRNMERFKDLVESREPVEAGHDATDEPDDRVPLNAAPAPDVDDDASGAASTRLPSLSRLRGMTVRNGQEKIGKVREVYLDPDADRVRYIGVSTGWLARGIHVIPIDDVTYTDDGAEPEIQVPYSTEHVKRAPTLDDDDELTDEREREIYDHYDRAGYWEEAREAVRARQTTPAPTPQIAEATARDAIDKGKDPAGMRVRRLGD